MGIRRRLLAFVASVVYLVLSGAPANAQVGQDFAVYPSGDNPGDRPFFAYDVAPGDVVDDVLRIVNFAESPRTFQIYAADGYNTSDVGTFALRQAEEEKQAVGRWTVLSADRWTIPALSRVDIPLRVEVPDDATPGDHVGGVVVLQMPTGGSDDEGALGLTVQRGLGARIYLRVSGPVQPRLAIEAVETSRSSVLSPFSPGAATTTFAVTNIGNVRMSPTVNFRVTGPWGDIERADLGAVADLLPGSTVIISHQWSGIPAGGKITQSIVLTDGEFSYARDLSFWIVPWWAILLVLLVGTALALIVRRWRRSRRELSDLTRSLAGGAMVVLVAVFGAQFAGVPAASAAAPELLVRPGDPVVVGDSIVVSGVGWPGRSNLLVEICGNEGAGGSQDCAVAEGRTAATSPDGRFSIEIPVVEPPAPCPCVVRARTVTGDSTLAVESLSFAAGPGSSETTPDVSSSPSGVSQEGATGPTFNVDARFEGANSLAALFGGAPERTLVLTVENTGERSSQASFVSLAWSSVDESAGFLPLIAIERLEPGESDEYRVDVRFDALTYGEVAVHGEILGAGEPETFDATTSVYPWGLVALAATVSLAVVLFALWHLLSRLRSWKLKRRASAAAASIPHDLSVVVSEELDAAFETVTLVEHLDPGSAEFVRELATITARRSSARLSLSRREQRRLEAKIAQTLESEVDFGVPIEATRPRSVEDLLAQEIPGLLAARIGENPHGDPSAEECYRLVAEVSDEVMNEFLADLCLTPGEADELTRALSEELTSTLL